MIETNLNPPAINHIIPADYVQALNRLEELSERADNLAEEVGANRFERIQLACNLLLNKKWLREQRMDEAKAIEYLERKYFADLADIISLTKLRAIYQWQSEKAWWQERRFNLKVVNHQHEDWLYQQRREAGERPAPPPPERRFVPVSELRETRERLTDDVKHFRSISNNLKKDLEKRDETISRLAHTVQEVKEQQKVAVQQCQGEVEMLREENLRLKKENAQLKKQLQALEQKG